MSQLILLAFSPKAVKVGLAEARSRQGQEPSAFTFKRRLVAQSGKVVPHLIRTLAPTQP
jgi:hypothetical protein